MFGRKADKKGNRKGNGGIVILAKTEPGMCGGTDATQDTNAPKKISSEKMILFDVRSALGYGGNYGDNYSDNYGGNYGGGDRPGATPCRPDRLAYVSAFAVPAGTGSFVFLETAEGPQRHAQKTRSWKYVKRDVFPSLVKLVNDLDLAAKNGFHSETHGLPENFGGSVHIEYESGETVSYSNNQSPVLSRDAAVNIARLFSEALASEAEDLPDADGLTGIRFSETRKNGAFTTAFLTVNPDGTGVNKKQSRYADPAVFESETPVEKEKIDAIKNIVKSGGMLAWPELPVSDAAPSGPKELRFFFRDGREIAVSDDRAVPGELRGAFFDIELEMTVRY